MSTNLAQLLHAQADLRPEQPAMLDYQARGRGRTGRPVTYADLREAVAQGAAFLQQCGLQPGDRVLLMQPISVDLYIALGAIFQAGLTAVFIDPGMGLKQIKRAAEALAPRAFLAMPRAHLLRLLLPSVRRIPCAISTGRGVPFTRSWRALNRMPSQSSIAPCAENSPALITATSGSTGAPKLATRSHSFLRCQHQAIDATLALPPGTVVATNLPIFILSFLASGVAVLLPDVDLRRPAQVQTGPLLAQMEAARVTCLAASPGLLDALARHCQAEERELSQITRIYSGGAPVFPDLAQRLHDIAPHAEITTIYGATEAEPIAALPHTAITAHDRRRMAHGHGLLVGAPIAAIEVQVIPDRWGEPLGPYDAQTWAHMAQPVETPGEIVVAGAHVLAGTEGLAATEPAPRTPTSSVAAPGAQSEAAANGEPAKSDGTPTTQPPPMQVPLTQIMVEGRSWHRTGDAGYFDEEGRLWLLGRCAAKLAPRADIALPHHAYPFAVETALHMEGDVRHAALVDQDGRRVLAIETATSLSPSWLTDVQRRLAWAGIDEVILLRQMPVDSRHNAKINYPALHRILQRQR